MMLKKIISKIILFILAGCLLRVLIGFAQYHARIIISAREEDEWYRNLAECESLLIEKGDTSVYYRFLRTIVEYGYDNCGMEEIRLQVLPSIILANRYADSYACVEVFYTTTQRYIYEYESITKTADKQKRRERIASDWSRFFLERSMSFRDEIALFYYDRFLMTGGSFSPEDSIYGAKIEKLYRDYDENDSIKLWTEIEKLPKPWRPYYLSH